MDTEHQTKLTDALSSILEPLSRLCIRNEVTYAELMELARMAYVHTAQTHFRLPDSEMTNARIAVLTGMSRKHVKHVKEALSNKDASTELALNRAQRVVHGWLNDAEFLDNENTPLVLPLKNKKNSKEFGSFVALVKRYSGDVSYGAILDELNHAQVTRQPDEHTVALVNNAYVPFKSDAEQIRIIGKSVTDLFNAALHNIESDEDDKRLQRQVVYSHIDEALVDELQLMIEEHSKLLLDKLNAGLAAAKEKSDKNSSNLKRVGFGVYYIEDVITTGK